MLFSENGTAAEIVGVYKDERSACSRKSFERRHSSLTLRISGCSEFCYDGKSLAAPENSIIYIPSKIKYSQKTKGEVIISVWFINYGKEPDRIEEITPSDFEFFKDAFSEMHRIWNEKRRGYKNLCSSILYSVFYQISRLADDCAENSPESNKIKSAVDYIHKNYRNGEIKISSLAKTCFISEPYFRRLFKSILGETPNKYIRQLRLEYARSLLEGRICSVSEACERSGFSDAKYFSKEFKKNYGTSPVKYRSKD